MKHLVQTAYAAALIGLSSNVCAAAVSGINYDPAHDPDWVQAQGDKNITKMQAIFTRDLAQIKAMGFATIKTYYSTYCTDSGCIDPVAKLAQAAGLNVMLGVYIFPADKPTSWTDAQVRAAIDQKSDPGYGQAVIGVVVGNEDMFDASGKANDDIQQRIVKTILLIRGAGGFGDIPVTTAQREPDWRRLKDSDPNNVLGQVQTIGANIFPYWGGSPEKNSGKSVASETQTKASNLLTALAPKGVTRVIITEEGWPSCAGNWQGQYPANASIDKEKDYFSTWSSRESPAYDSYYFMAYDMNDDCNVALGNRDNDSDKHFGLCSATGQTKDKGLKTCPAPN
jgi:exo-beta-1,3-glucanase (GH17 family)